MKHCRDCHYFSHPYCVRKSGGIVEDGHIIYENPEYVADAYSCEDFRPKFQKESQNER